MMNMESRIPLDMPLAVLALLEIVIGALVLACDTWMAVGGVVLAIGMVTLWLARQFAIAPCLD